MFLSHNSNRVSPETYTATQETFYTSLRPLALLCKLFGAFSLQNAWQSDGRQLRHRWVSLHTLWGPFLYLSVSTVYTCFETNEWWRFMLPPLWGRVLVTISVCVFYDKYLPELIRQFEDFDEKFAKLSSRNSYRNIGFIWAILTVSCLLIYYCAILIERPDFQSYWFLFLMSIIGIASLFPRILFINTYMFFCYSLSLRFLNVQSLWNEVLNKILDEQQYHVVPPEDQLEMVRLLHADLVRIANQLSRCYGVRLAVFLAMIFTGILIDLYQFIYTVPVSTYAPVIYNVFNSLSLFCVANFSGDLANSSEAIFGDLCGVPLNRLSPSCQLQVHAFHSQLAMPRRGVSAAGFCTVNRGLIVSMMMSLTTYFIVIMQFSKQLTDITSRFN